MKDLQESQILEYLNQNKQADILELASILYCSPSTVRRKVTALQKKGLVTRTHGGVKLNDDNNFSPSFIFRSHQNSLEKKKMALASIKLIKNGDVIFLDGSTSTFFIAEYLQEFKNIKVVTNGIDTLSLLSKNNIEAYSTGGFVSPQNRSVLIGHHAEQTISSFHADIAFFSVQSVDKNGGVYDCFEEENVIRKQMIKNASKSVLICNNSKFNQTSSYKLCTLSDIDYLITDKIDEKLDINSIPNLPTIISAE